MATNYFPEKPRDDYFIMECEAHPIPAPDCLLDVAYFKSFTKFIATTDGCQRGTTGHIRTLDMSGEEFEKMPKTQPEALVWSMDQSGCDVACCIPEFFYNTNDHSKPWMTNGLVQQYADKYPDRLLACPNFTPSIRKMEDVLWEMEYFAKEKNCKCLKYYPPEETVPMNDKLLWPFWEKAEELGYVVQIHSGMAYTYRGKTEFCMPLQLEDVCNDFFDLKVHAFHMGWPWTDIVNVLAGQFPNFYVGLSWTNRTLLWKPRFFAKLLGEALNWATSDKIIWGCDGDPDKEAIEAFKKFQFPEDLQEGYGFKPITEDDKAKIFGLNLARLLGIEPTKRAKVFK
jgi:predicted TIM-barrel fold metal-dependent hydrolase